MTEVTHKPYELMLVFKPDILESALEKKLKEFDEFLGENEGKVDLKDLWGKRDLAYNIKQYSQGLYVVYNATLPTSFLQELDEHLRINNDVLRFLVLSLDQGYTYEKPNVPNTDSSRAIKKQVPPETEAHKAHSPKPKEEKMKEKEDEGGVESDPSKNLDKKLESILNDDELKL